MRNTDDEQAEIEAAKERLRRFGKPANQCRNYHDPERWAAAKEGRKFLPRRNGWAEIGRRFRTM